MRLIWKVLKVGIFILAIVFTFFALLGFIVPKLAELKDLLGLGIFLLILSFFINYISRRAKPSSSTDKGFIDDFYFQEQASETEAMKGAGGEFGGGGASGQWADEDLDIHDPDD